MALLLGIALGGGNEGGFDLETRHIAGICAWLFVVALLVFGAAARARAPGPLYLVAGLLLSLAALSALSSLWSGSTELSVIEAERVLVYLGILIAAFLITQTGGRRQRFTEGLALAAATIAVVAVASRVLPDVIQVRQPPEWGPRLTYPLGYWNANGAMFALAVPLLLWTSRRTAATVLRFAAVAAIPVALLGLYFTYSRGGVLAMVVGSIALLALSRDRLWLGATLLVTMIAALPAVLAVQGRSALEDRLNSPAAIDQGHEVLTILLLAIAGALICFAALRWLERREGRLTLAMVRLSRNQALLGGIAVFAAAFAAVVALTLGPKAWDRFSENDIQLPNQPSKHFTDLTGSGRREFWRVAYRDFTDRPLVGQGAGSYEMSYEQRRRIRLPVHDAHSLYLETFAELGLVGGLLLLAMFGSVGAIGLRAWSRAVGAERERSAVLWAVARAFAVTAAFDWFWELPGLGAVFFLAAGALISARCEQLAAEDEEVGIPDSGRRYWLIALGLVAAWVSAAALVAPVLVDREITASQEAAASGDLATARNHAENARSIEPWAASPYVQLGLLDELRGDHRAAAERFSDAIEREDRNWQLYFLRARVERELGNRAAARADIAKARELNPLAPELAGSEG
ncbi:MAG: O-antigen ligase family protein [Solirubrobacterales bacterium]